MSNTCTNAQQAAIRHTNGPCMVIAGPGSGKTFVITRRIQNLIEKHGVSPEKILVITFSKAAAMEMKERFHKLCGEKSYNVVFGTFHAIYFQILQRAYQLDYTHIIKEYEKYRMIEDILRKYPDEVICNPDFIESLLREISVVKNEGKGLNQYHSKCVKTEIFVEIYKEYQNKMRQAKKIDFDDMVLLTYELLKKREDLRKQWQKVFSYILIDEFQDINAIQFAVIRMLAEPENHLFVVGDDDQSIYGFRGSKPEIMLHFKDYYKETKTVLLDYNFRSDAKIVEMALKVISDNKSRYEKAIKTTYDYHENALSVCLYDTEDKEMDALAGILKKEQKKGHLNQCAVLFRHHASLSRFAEAMCGYEIPIRTCESVKTLYDHELIKDVEAYFRFVKGEQSVEHLLRFMNKPNRFIKNMYVRENGVDFKKLRQVMPNSSGKEAVEKLERDLKRMENLTPFAGIVYLKKAVGYENYVKEYAKKRGVPFEEVFRVLEKVTDLCRKVPCYEDLFEELTALREYANQALDRDLKEDAVNCMTMHRAKGLEWDTVLIPNCNRGSFPSRKAFLQSEVEEERRLFYVGMTRAKKELILTGLKENTSQMIEASPFLNRIISDNKINNQTIEKKND